MYKRQDPDEAMLTFDDCNALELAMSMKDAMGDNIHITTMCIRDSDWMTQGTFYDPTFSGEIRVDVDLSLIYI